MGINIEPLFDKIIEGNDKESVWSTIQEDKSDFLDDGWEEEFDDIEEAYIETGRNTAGAQTLNSLIQQTGYTLFNDDHCELFDKLAEYYELDTN